jgi:hypothetical protein
VQGLPQARKAQAERRVQWGAQQATSGARVEVVPVLVFLGLVPAGNLPTRQAGAAVAIDSSQKTEPTFDAQGS